MALMNRRLRLLPFIATRSTARDASTSLVPDSTVDWDKGPGEHGERKLFAKCGLKSIPLSQS